MSTVSSGAFVTVTKEIWPERGLRLNKGTTGRVIEDGQTWTGQGGRHCGVRCRFRLDGQSVEAVVPWSAVRRC